MKRWNGWGEETINAPLSAAATTFLQHIVGVGTPSRDATLEEVVAHVPPSRLPPHPLISHDPLERIGHARGQSLPDWIALRSGRIDSFPDGVAYPESESEVRDLISYARKVGAHLIPYGGGTSVVGHINPLASDKPVLTVDLKRLSRLYTLNETNRLATFGAGITGIALEAQLRAHGYTLGHFPQSFEYSTLGGWIAARSSGQQSLGYGRIEQLFAGGHVETPSGALEVQLFPASATGMDLLEIVLFFSSRRRHTRFDCDWSSDVCSSDLGSPGRPAEGPARHQPDVAAWPEEPVRGRADGLAAGVVDDGARCQGCRPRAGGRQIGRASCRERV